MTRIKSDNVQLSGSFVVPIEQSSHSQKIQEAIAKEKEIILNAERRAQEIIEQAHIQSQQIIEEAKNQANSEYDSIVQKAHEEGFTSGHQEGFDQITQELQEKIISVENFAQSNFEIKKSIVKSAHNEIIQLVVHIAEKICTKALEIDKNILTEVTVAAIQALKEKENITIIINPSMAEKIYSISDELKERIPQLETIKIIEDSSVSPDGSIVEAPISRIDSRIKSQINEISDKLMAKIDSTSFEDNSDVQS